MNIKDKRTLRALQEKYGVNILRENINEAFFNRYKESPYDDNAKQDGFSTQPLKKNVGLFDIRQRLEEIWRNCHTKDIEIAEKQAKRLYKMVDAMINQGYIVEK